MLDINGSFAKERIIVTKIVNTEIKKAFFLAIKNFLRSFFVSSGEVYSVFGTNSSKSSCSK